MVVRGLKFRRAMACDLYENVVESKQLDSLAAFLRVPHGPKQPKEDLIVQAYGLEFGRTPHSFGFSHLVSNWDLNRSVNLSHCPRKISGPFRMRARDALYRSGCWKKACKSLFERCGRVRGAAICSARRVTLARARRGAKGARGVTCSEAAGSP